MASLPVNYAKSFIRAFIARALRDARDWEEGLRIVPREALWHVEADIPTSSQNCWLDFDIVEHDEGMRVENLQALRSGSGLDTGSVYLWDERKGAWQLVANEASV